jgi:heptosyltransferase-1
VKILLVRVSSLGDVLHNLPIVADIRRHFPDAVIDWVVEEGYVSLVRLNPGVRKIIPWGLRRWRKSLGQSATRAEVKGFFRDLRAEEYDFILDTQGLIKTGIIMAAARGRNKIGFANGTDDSGYEGISRIFHTKSYGTEPRAHAVQRGRLLAAQALGYSLGVPADFGLPAPEGAVRPPFLPAGDYAVFFHGTARAAKKWDDANWIAVAKALAPLPVLLPWGSAQEKTEAEALAAHMPNAQVLPKLSMDDAVQVARFAKLAIGVDTGLTHIAAAFVRPTIEIYRDSPRWKTEGNWSPRIINLGDSGHPPSVDEVLAAVRKLN